MDRNECLVCFGAGEKSKHIKQVIQRYSSKQVLYYVENQAFFKIGTYFDELEVISIYKMKELYENRVIGGVVISTAYHKRTVQDMIETCSSMGIKDEDILLVNNSTIVAAKPMNGEVVIPYKKCVQIYDLNIHLVDHCNLNCELCCHNSQLVEGEVFVDFDSFCKDLIRLHEIIPDIVQITLLGGEPMLHPDLIQFMDFTRQIYPYTRIAMVTNGILLRQSSQELLECFKRNKIDIVISLYPPMHQQLDSLIQYTRQTGISVSIHRVDRFFKKFCEEPRFDSKEMSDYCGYCMGLRNGRISRCIDSLFIEYFNAKFGDILPETEGYDIYDKTIDSLALIHALEQPMELCAYCGSKYTLVDTYQWKQITKNVVKEDIMIS